MPQQESIPLRHHQVLHQTHQVQAVVHHPLQVVIVVVQVAHLPQAVAAHLLEVVAHLVVAVVLAPVFNKKITFVYLNFYKYSYTFCNIPRGCF